MKTHIEVSRVIAVAAGCLITFVVAAGCKESPPGDGTRISYEGYGLPPVDQYFSHESIVRVDTLQGETVLDSTQVIYPRDLHISGKRLFVLEHSPPPVIRAFDVGNWEEILVFGRQGSGPGEFRNAFRFVPSLRGDVWVFDRGLRRLTRIIRNSAEGLLALDTLTVRLDFAEPVLDFAWISDTTLVAQGLFGNERFGLLSSSGELLSEIGGVPPGDDRVPVRARNQFQWGWLAAHPEGTRFAHLRTRAGQVSIIDRSGQSIIAAKTPFDFECGYVYEVETGGLVVTRDQRTGYIDVDVTNRRVFALFSGRPYIRYGTNMYHGLFVHEFDWSGELRRVFRLELAAESIAVDESGAFLYASHPLPVPEVRRYALPPERNEPE